MTCADMKNHINISFGDGRMLKIYLLQLFLRAKHVFKIQIKEDVGIFSEGVESFQLL